MTELYEEATAELRRMREKERPATDMETRIRRLECERDEALAKVRTAQVDNEELKIKLDVGTGLPLHSLINCRL